MHLLAPRSLACLLAAAVLAPGAAALAGGEGWVHDMDEAMKQAKAENKMIMMDFTGSDWCGWCIKLNDEVFSQSLFKEEVPERFVLVELDFPARKELSEEQKKHNEMWRDKFKIQGYPTIVLADAQGKPFARTGYRAGGAAPYVEHLDGLLKGKHVRDVAFGAAGKLDGLARAKMLDWALTIEDIEVDDRETLMQEIIRLDAENLAGLKSTYEMKFADMKLDEALAKAQEKMFSRDGGDPEAAKEILAAAMAEFEISTEKHAEVAQFLIMIDVMNGQYEAAEAKIDETLALEGIETEMQQQIAMMRVQLYAEKGDVKAAIEAFDKAIEMAPDSDFGKMLAGDRDQFLEMLEQMAASKDGMEMIELEEPGDDDDGV